LTQPRACPPCRYANAQAAREHGQAEIDQDAVATHPSMTSPARLRVWAAQDMISPQ
jgi:hypothetical protein